MFDVHILFSLDEFIIRVSQVLNVVFVQLHFDSWISYKSLKFYIKFYI